MISGDKEAEILRLYHVEKWKVGTISKQIFVHRSVVERVLASSGISAESFKRGRSKADPYVPFIRETLSIYPTLCASRLFQMVKERGYDGAPDHFRAVVARYRLPRRAEAYLRLRTLPGDQAQVDWGHFGKIKVGNAERTLSAFVMVLSYSRQIFLRFYFNAATPSFLQGHRDAFEFFGGIPRVLLYDNLKSAVIERIGNSIRFNSTLVQMAGYYRFEPRPVNVARGNEKGRVERAIRYIRDNFFAARKFSSIEDLNKQAFAWMIGPCADRICPEDRAATVRVTFMKEKSKLLPLPDDNFPCDERLEVHVGKTPYIRFDLNDYSVPSQYACRTLTAIASPTTVKIVDGATVVATHSRCWERGRQLENREHILELQNRKSASRENRGFDRLFAAAPHARQLMDLAATRGASLGQLTYRLNQLLDYIPAADLEEAIKQAVSAQTVTLGAVRHLLDQIRAQRGQSPQVPWRVANNPKAEQVVVRQHDLSTYDPIKQEEDDDLPF